MKFLLLASIVLCGCFFAAPTMAALGSSQGTVQQTWTYGNAMMLVGGFNFVLAAKASGAVLTVVAKTDNCWRPEITADSSTYIYSAP